MRKTVLFGCFFLLWSFPSLFAGDFQRFSLGLDYFGGNITETHKYPDISKSSTHNQLNGASALIKIGASKNISIVSRFELNSLRLPEFSFSDVNGKITVPDFNQASGKEVWLESGMVFKVPELAHEFGVSYAINKLGRNSEFFSQDATTRVDNKIISHGFVFSISGHKRITSKLDIDYSVRGFPRFIRGDKTYSSLDVDGAQLTTSGWELRGTFGYRLTKNFSLIAGYKYRRFNTPNIFSNPQSAVDEVRVVSGWIFGGKITF